MFSRVLVYVVFFLIVSPAGAQTATEAVKDVPSAPGDASSLPPALKELRAYIDAQQTMDFKTAFHTSSNVLNIESQGSAHFLVRKPNQFRIEVSAQNASYEYVSDGTVLTILNIPQKTYAQVAARATVQGNMSLIAGLMGFQARIFDFFAALDQASDGLASIQITAKGAGTVGGRECDRFIMTSMVEKWDVSLEMPAPHLPCKLVSGDVDDPSATSQVNEFTWEKAPNITPDTFVFSPPPGSKKTDVGSVLAAP
ncbi:DUF2092 domain-containing protein [Hyphomicrobium facile]|uniref:Outer membrane lipoprotein-sorting protein n=1 Tax=Hyphomicrobium facile TaxID=51670 RepID=A0A1I7NID3_9HYPH|nr:DUF2092 domain-containing protein [Hyphomicrobium facile]SFV34326.1 hypothetical protein SAMN04488557_2289 [Hyphomicrobium facile]